MTRQLPAERPLPHKQDILERVLADEAVSSRRRPWLVPIAAAASIAVIAGGLVFVTSRQGDKPVPGPAAGPVQTKSGTPKGKPQPAGPADIAVNVGPVSSTDAKALAKACLTELREQPGKVGQISRAVKVRNWGDPRKTDDSVVVLDKSNGLIYACVGHRGASSRGGGQSDPLDAGLIGGDPVEARKGKSVINPTDATHPAAPTDHNGMYFFVDFDGKPDKLATDFWYRVDDRVAAIRQRWVIRDKPGPWFVADAVDGFAFVRTWDQSTSLKKGEKVRMETQVLGHQGELLDAPADQKGGGGLTPSPGKTRVDIGTVVGHDDPNLPPLGIDFKTR